ncbi:uncharacterized protein [Elaeis guineensis]|uniref:Uncharacterized protein LOC105056271 n=1 Tax=Elaeis guineensis var. tenera TaxID=51953 RepID=A0A6I9S2W3_ELAGV|nr:uncharacterized protein LOC105056271 [Elaeis guineensis]XP_010936711.1 uncharacterized protein LOC105056271 [Elaeis guineensis]
METLEATETLRDNSSKKPSETQTLEPLGGPRVSELGFSLEEEPLAPAPGAEAKTLGSGLTLEAGEREELHSFAVGDFVWGKIKSHPWWPGQVYDPSRASDHAKRAHRRDRSVLVAYFGDDTFAWCHPAQLRPFVLEFQQMVKQSSSRSFVSAVEDVVGEIGRCLELELTCHCVPPEVRPASARGQVGRAPVANFAPLEFLEHLRDVACDVSVVDILEGAMLRSWVLAFGKGWSNGSAGYHRRRGIMDLVDKIDLDVPPGDLADSKEEEEYWITGSSVVKGPKISAEKLFRNRKKRSMAKLIAEMDLDAVEVSDGEDEKVEEKVKEKVDSGKRKKKTENEKGSEMENIGVKAEEEGGSGRRERKKSKYLSPPYTYLSGYTKYVASPRSAEMKTPRTSIDSSGPLSPKSQTILKCNCDTVQKEEDKMSPSFQVDSTSVHEILVEFLCTAVNPLHLKWNRLAKTIRGFFAIYRSCMYSSGSDCESYQKHLTESCGINGKTPTVHRPEVGKSEGKRKQKKDGPSGETRIVLGPDSVNHSKEGKVGRKRRARKDAAAAAAEPLVNLEPQIVDVPVEGKLSRRFRKGKDGANGESMVNLSQEPLSPSEAAKLGQKMVRRKGVANGKSPVELGHELSGRSQVGKSGQRRRKSRNAPNTLHVLDLDRAIANGPNEGKSGQKRRKKDGNNHGNPAALHMNFAPGITLPSRDDLISTFSKYGVLIESETELLQETGSARVVFVKSTDAEKAFNSLDKTGVFGPPYATYRLRYLPAISSPPSSPIPVPKPPLPYIRKSLERMISSLAGSSTSVKETGCSDGLKPEARDNLVGEMQGLLKKVNKMLNGPAAGTPF